MREVYLDNNATTRVADEVMEAMAPFFTKLYGNPSSMHTFGQQAQRPMDDAREQVAEMLHCTAREIVFTGCATESNNAAIYSALEALPTRRRLITSKVEHPAVLEPFDHYGKKGKDPVFIAVDASGRFNMDAFEEMLDENTALVSMMWANNETGVVFPIKEIAEKAKAKGALVHCDAVQGGGKIDLDLNDVPVDLLSLAGHKMYAPKGVGVLYIRDGLKLPPLLLGGHHENGHRAGTQNVPYIVGMGRAALLAMENVQDEETRIRGLRDRLEKGLLQTCPDARVNGDPDLRLPNTSNISFEYVEGESILLMMDRFGICASSGSACSSGSLNPSHVLRAMDVPFTAAHGSIRFSLGRYNTEADVDAVLEHLPPIIQRLREISPFGRDGK